MIRPNLPLLLICAFPLGLGGCSKTSSPLQEPLSVALSHQSHFYDWKLTVDSQGNGRVAGGRATFVHPPKRGMALSYPKARRFKVSATQLTQLRQALVKERFFQLGGQYGESVPDGGASSLKITQGRKSKEVILLFLGNWESEGFKHHPEAQRADRIWNLIEGWSQ